MRRTNITFFATGVLLIQSLIAPVGILAQDAKNAEINAAIRKEEMEHSKIMHTLHIFTDLYGPRLTGSPNHVAAARWAAEEMK